MKKIQLIFLLLICMAIAHAQTYTEITEGGWGRAINWTRPAIADIDSNGRYDLIVGNITGKLYHFEQETTGSGTFTLQSENFNNISIYNPAPRFVDFNHDGLLDLIVGQHNGYLHHFQQEAAMSTTFNLVAENFNDIDVGIAPYISFTDIDNNGLLDMVIGNSDGNLFHYEQISMGADTFNLLTDNFNIIDVGKDAAPFFSDINGDGLLDLIIGNSGVHLQHFEQNSPGSTTFNQVTSTFSDLTVHDYSTPVIMDIDNNGQLDMILGSGDGFLMHYEQSAIGSENFTHITDDLDPRDKIDVGSTAYPAFTDLDDDGLLDMLVGQSNGKIFHYEQETVGSSNFNLISNAFNNIDAGFEISVELVDITGNGLLDLFVGRHLGEIHHYEQDTAGSLAFNSLNEQFLGIDVGDNACPRFVDLDGNSRFDLIIGNQTGNLIHYEQDMTGSTSFTLISEQFNSIDVQYYASPCFTDLDDNGLIDMLVGNSYGNLYHYQQDSIGSTSFSLITDNFYNISIGTGVKPVFVDINGDGLDDLMIGDNYGGVHYYQREEDTKVSEYNNTVPSFILYPNHPNPFNPSTMISYELAQKTNVTLEIYNVRGARIKTLINESQDAGKHTLYWYGTDDSGSSVSSGIYLCHMHAHGYQKTIRMLYLK